MPEESIPRRSYLKVAGAATTGALAGCAGGGGDTPTPRVQRETVVRERTVVQERTVVRTRPQSELTPLHSLEPEGGITIPAQLYGIQNGAWRRHGIDYSLEVAPFGKFTRQVTQDLADIGGHSAFYAIQFMNQGEEDMVSIGQQLNFYNSILAKADSPLEEIEDLGDATLGLPFSGSLTTKLARSIILDGFDFDIVNDPAESRFAAPPVLWNLMMSDELDAILEFSGFVLRAAATDEVKTIFNPAPYWRDRTGVFPSTADYVAKRSWLEDNPETARNFLRGWEDAVTLFRENTAEALQNFGRLGGVTTEAQAAVVHQWLEDRLVFGPFDYNQQVVDSTWEMFQLMQDAGEIETIPKTKDELFVTSSELAEMAG